MNRFFQTIFPVLFLLFFFSCDMFDVHPYDVNVKGGKNINNTNINKIENACLAKDTIKFAVMGDTQGWYDETKDFVNSLNTKDSIDFVIHLGDISDYGATKEFMWQRDIMNKLKVPYTVLIGNHDCIATGKDSYKTIFGPVNFSFIAGGIKFVCLNTNAMEYDYSEPVPDFDFIINEATARKDQFEHSIVCMHVPPFSDVFNNNVSSVFERYIKELPDLMFCLNGHNHTLAETDLFNDGNIYYQTASIDKRSYFIFTVSHGKYRYEVVNF